MQYCVVESGAIARKSTRMCYSGQTNNSVMDIQMNSQGHVHNVVKEHDEEDSQ